MTKPTFFLTLLQLKSIRHPCHNSANSWERSDICETIEPSETSQPSSKTSETSQTSAGIENSDTIVVAMMTMQQTPWNNCAAEFAADKTLKRNLVQTLKEISLSISKDVFFLKQSYNYQIMRTIKPQVERWRNTIIS